MYAKRDRPATKYQNIKAIIIDITCMEYFMKNINYDSIKRKYFLLIACFCVPFLFVIGFIMDVIFHYPMTLGLVLGVALGWGWCSAFRAITHTPENAMSTGIKVRGKGNKIHDNIVSGSDVGYDIEGEDNILH